MVVIESVPLRQEHEADSQSPTPIKVVGDSGQMDEASDRFNRSGGTAPIKASNSGGGDVRNGSKADISGNR